MICFQNVSFSYGDKPLLRNLTFTLPDTGFVLILGRSGSGKTTLLSLLAGLLTPDEGTITGVDKKEISFVFQSPLLLDYLSAGSNVELVDRFDGVKEKKGKASLKLVSLEECYEKSPKKLSGGEQVRVAIARALEKGGDLLILDEPTGQLDEKTSFSVYETLKKLSKDHLIVLVSHDETTAPLFADELYVLEKGKLVLKYRKEEKKVSRKEKPKRKRKSLTLEDSLELSWPFLKKHKVRTFFAAFFLAFNLCLSYLGLNLQFHKEEAIASLFADYYAGEVTKISKKEEIAQSGRLHLERNGLPNEESLMLLDIDTTYPCLSYFVPSYNEVNLNKKSVSCAFYPVIEEKEERLSYGRVTKNYAEAVVNESFLEEFGLTEEEAIRRVISCPREVTIRSNKLESKDTISLPLSFSICGISKERKAFNQACVYYSHPEMLSYLATLELPNISEELGEEVTVKDLLEDDEYRSDDFMGQGSLFETENPSLVKNKAESYYGEKVSITSQRLSIEESTVSMISSLLKILLVFLALNILSAIMLEFLTIYSLYRENLRYFALLKVFHPGKKGFFISALGIELLFFVFSGLFLTALSLVSAYVLNLVTVYFSYPAFFEVLDTKSLLVVLLIGGLGCLFSALCPLRKIKDDQIKKQLEGED